MSCSGRKSTQHKRQIERVDSGDYAQKSLLAQVSNRGTELGHTDSSELPLEMPDGSRKIPHEW